MVTATVTVSVTEYGVENTDGVNGCCVVYGRGACLAWFNHTFVGSSLYLIIPIRTSPLLFSLPPALHSLSIDRRGRLETVIHKSIHTLEQVFRRGNVPRTLRIVNDCF